MDPEVPQLVEEPVELGLVGEVPGERGLAGPRVKFELIERVGEVFAEPPADDDPVAHVVDALPRESAEADARVCVARRLGPRG